MYSIAYVSTVATNFTDKELDSILKVSRDWNTSVGITGLLLYKGENFMQMLEGPKDAVLEILAKIRTDSRHHSMIILTQGEQPGREFSSWSMGFKRISSPSECPDGFSDVWEIPFSSEEFLMDPSRALALLYSFKMSMHPGAVS